MVRGLRCTPRSQRLRPRNRAARRAAAPARSGELPEGRGQPREARELTCRRKDLLKRDRTRSKAQPRGMNDRATPCFRWVVITEPSRAAARAACKCRARHLATTPSEATLLLQPVVAPPPPPLSSLPSPHPAVQTSSRRRQRSHAFHHATSSKPIQPCRVQSMLLPLCSKDEGSRRRRVTEGQKRRARL